ncbi:hypothetical protein GF406_26550 [candidate division KSB1 bacterium]|nr:hypothetical protein [candidate division KSB1 bacterium]
MNRRIFLKTIAATGVGFSLGCGNKQNHASSPDEIVEARHKVRQRKRRIIMNNDGNDLRRLEPDKAVTPESFLDMRTTPLVGTHVDAIFYCTGVFNLYKHNTREGELHLRTPAEKDKILALIEQDTDVLEIMTSFGHKNNMEIFWSMRMNDTHDSRHEHLFCDWKAQHPIYLIGEKGEKFPYGLNRWSSVDYNESAVRVKVFRLFEEVCSGWDVDGIEMDFFRHPILFAEQMLGKPVTQEHCDKLTDLVRRIRRMADEQAAKKGRPILMACRVPDSVDYCKAMGIDLIRWLEEDLIDIVTGGGYFKLEPWENLAALGEKYEVPVYACLVSRRLMNGGKPEADTAIKIWRGEALNAWQAGMDGIYTFNRFNPHDPIFRELGDPELLQTLDHVDQTTYIGNFGMSKPGRWLKDGKKYVKERKS